MVKHIAIKFGSASLLGMQEYHSDMAVHTLSTRILGTELTSCILYSCIGDGNTCPVTAFCGFSGCAKGTFRAPAASSIGDISSAGARAVTGGC